MYAGRKIRFLTIKAEEWPGKHSFTRQETDTQALLFLGNDPKTQRQYYSNHLIIATYYFINNKIDTIFIPAFIIDYSISNNHLAFEYIIYFIFLFSHPIR